MQLVMHCRGLASEILDGSATRAELFRVLDKFSSYTTYSTAFGERRRAATPEGELGASTPEGRAAQAAPDPCAEARRQEASGGFHDPCGEGAPLRRRASLEA